MFRSVIIRFDDGGVCARKTEGLCAECKFLLRENEDERVRAISVINGK